MLAKVRIRVGVDIFMCGHFYSNGYESPAKNYTDMLCWLVSLYSVIVYNMYSYMMELIVGFNLLSYSHCTSYTITV